jgi:defect-in-organelle-trafficking protein DotD
MKKYFLVSLAIALAGCATKQELDVTDTIEAERQLVAAAQSIEHSLRLLSAAEAQSPQPLMDISELVSEEAGLGVRATLDWSGPIQPLLERIAKLTDYRMRVIGHAPSIPVMVSITDEERVVAEILKDAGLQAGNKAALVVYPSTRVIELRYLPVS